ncbi:MAG: hypothetical protein PVF68_11650 [Acidobacteriota bacterium]|jgi:hypothetical protein
MAAGQAPWTAKPIPMQEVENTRQEVAGFDSDRIRLHGRRFLREQPEMARFLTSLTRDAAGPAVELTFYLGCIAWTMFRRAYGGRLPRISLDLLVENFERLRGDMERFVGSDSRFLESYLRGSEFMRQAHVVRFIVDSLLEEREDWSNLGCVARGICLVVLLSTVEAMDQAVIAVDAGLSAPGSPAPPPA